MTDQLIEEVRGKVQELERTHEKAVATVNRMLQHLPEQLEYLATTIVKSLIEYNKVMVELTNPILYLMQNAGSPSKLERYADMWRDKIAKPLGDVSDDVALNKLSTVIGWSGDGAAAYHAVVPTQGQTLTGMKALALTISTALRDLAKAITDFWIGVGVAVATATVAAAGIAVSCFAPNPVAITIAITAVGAAIVLVDSAQSKCRAMADAIKAKQDLIHQGLNDLGTEWETATPLQAQMMADPTEWKR